jgi:ATPase subunit of ABC transporter with duplicated ATPase domains
MSNNENITTQVAEKSKRVYKKPVLVIKKFLDKEAKKILTDFTKNHKKVIAKNMKEAQKEKVKMDKEKAKEDKKAEKEAEKLRIKQEKEKAKADKKAEKEAEKQRIKEAKKAEKEALKEEKKTKKKEQTKVGGNVLSVINTQNDKKEEAPQVNLMEEAREELQEEQFISVDELTSLALSEVPTSEKTKKPRVKGRGRPKKANLGPVEVIGNENNTVEV